MSYQKYYPNGWQSGEAGRTPITPEALSHIEDGIFNSAPAGYGLGARGKDVSGQNLNDLYGNGWFYWETATNMPFDWGYMQQIEGGESSVQIAYKIVGDASVTRKKHSWGGSWGEWEWENPPMVMGVEYRTTKRWNGKPVYTKSVGCGAMGQNVEDVVTHNAANVELVRIVGGYWYNGTTWHSVPYYGSIDNNYILASAWANNIRRIHKGNYYTIADMSVVLEYTKTTD